MVQVACSSCVGPALTSSGSPPRPVMAQRGVDGVAPRARRFPVAMAHGPPARCRLSSHGLRRGRAGAVILTPGGRRPDQGRRPPPRPRGRPGSHRRPAGRAHHPAEDRSPRTAGPWGPWAPGRRRAEHRRHPCGRRGVQSGLSRVSGTVVMRRYSATVIWLSRRTAKACKLISAAFAAGTAVSHHCSHHSRMSGRDRSRRAA
jgi:hypothetical protein